MSVEQVQGTVQVTGHSHGLSQKCIPGRAANLAAARFKNRDAGLERANSFGDLAFPDKGLAPGNGRQLLPEHGKAALPAQPLTVFGALSQVSEGKAAIELVWPQRQRKSEVEDVAAHARMQDLFRRLGASPGQGSQASRR